MSAVVLSTRPGSIGFGRLWTAELVKVVDTRAGRVVSAASIVAGAGVMAALVATGAPGGLSALVLITAGLLPATVLVPVLAILVLTGEWARRTTLVTFVLEPRRIRVAAAKVLAVITVGTGCAVAVVGLGLLGHGLAHLHRGTPWALSVEPEVILGATAGQLIWLLSAVGWALVVQQPTGAIVAFFAVPVTWTTLGLTVPVLAGPARWLDLAQTSAPLLTGLDLDGSAWARLGVSVLVWVVLPVTVGLLRWNRREVA